MLSLFALGQIATLPVWHASSEASDWLIQVPRTKAAVYRSADSRELILANGLLARRILIAPNAATISLRNLRTGEEFVRAVRPEAIVSIDGKTIDVGGLTGQPNRAFLAPEWLADLKATPGSLGFLGFEVGKPRERLKWKKVRHSPASTWPPKGVSLTLWFEGKQPAMRVGVHYELYDGIPLMMKWISVQNEGEKAVRLDRFVAETLAVVEPESIVDSSPEWRKPNLSVHCDYSFGGMAATASNRTVHWLPDPEYKTQVNYEMKTPCLLEVKPPFGPAIDLKPKETFQSFHVFELLHDNTDRERQGLALRRMFRTVAPWSQENPLMLHLTSSDPAVVRRAVDQASECGFEMIVISFWSGLDMEDSSDANIAKWRELREYANSKGIELGGYSLLASRSIDKENDVVNPKPIFGASPCLQSKWGEQYFEKVSSFLTKTGFNLLEHDGSYPGDTCASTTHPGHRDFDDSQWMQYQRIAKLYADCLANGVFLNVPDNYFLAGSNKTGMGYRESNWSLPREQQHIHARQNLYDGTWEKTPSMGWMMVPLVEYQGGGPAATIEPLKDHLPDYEMHLANNLGYGAQACYRGPRLYDSPEVKAAVIKWVTWFKKYRAILESDIVHLRRPDSARIDGILHVNPSLPERGMAVFWNPTDQELTEDFTVPLTYTGLTGKCKVREQEGKAKTLELDRKDTIKLRVKIPPRGMTWFVLTSV
ncbi:MAG: hypothetical protein K1X67_19025 [Fimbriimonadaceae bacterium]|nr:hypothetical protein [Fimbriimonadaceae bacterium]